MTSVEVANQGDVEALVELEGLLFAEDAGVHDACMHDQGSLHSVTHVRRL